MIKEALLDTYAVIKHNQYVAWLLVLTTFIALVYSVYTYLPVHENANPPISWGFSVDWKGCIRTDILKLLAGRSPYEEGCGLNPPWTYILLAPIAILPPDLGAAVIFTLTYLVYIYALHKAGARYWMLLGVTCTYFVLANAQTGNIDWLPVLGIRFASANWTVSAGD